MKLLPHLRILATNILPNNLFDILAHLSQHYKYGNHRYIANIFNPKTFNEKIIWLKLNHRFSNGTKLVDKYLVKNIVSELIGPEYLIPTLNVFDSVEEIDPNKLPQKCVLKPNHGSGMVVFYDKKSGMDVWDSQKIKLRKWLDLDVYKETREWQYKNIPRKIIVEPLIDEMSKVIDYKFYCFDGKVKIICLDMNRFANHKRNFVDCNWNLLPYIQKFENGKLPEKPSNFDEMINICEKLSAGLIFSRIDLYNINNEIKFGEITLHPSSGHAPFETYQQDLGMGSFMNLPISN